MDEKTLDRAVELRRNISNLIKLRQRLHGAQIVLLENQTFFDFGSAFVGCGAMPGDTRSIESELKEAMRDMVWKKVSEYIDAKTKEFEAL